MIYIDIEKIDIQYRYRKDRYTVQKIDIAKEIPIDIEKKSIQIDIKN